MTLTASQRDAHGWARRLNEVATMLRSSGNLIETDAALDGRPCRCGPHGNSDETSERWRYASFHNPPHEHEWTDHAYCVLCGIRYDSLPDGELP